jgi:hypothetical protein
MKPAQTLLKLVFACLILMLVQALAGLLLPLGVQGPNPGPWWLISNGIVVTVLTLVALRAPWKGWQLALVLSTLPMAIQLMNLVEGLAFLTHVSLPWRRLMLMTLLAYILALPLWRLLFGRNERTASTPAAPYAGAVWRLLVSAAVYVLLYLGAGMIIFPFVKSSMPPRSSRAWAASSPCSSSCAVRFSWPCALCYSGACESKAQRGTLPWASPSPCSAESPP